MKKKHLWLIGILVALVTVFAVACSSTPSGGTGETQNGKTGTSYPIATTTTTATAYPTTKPTMTFVTPVPAPTTVTFTQPASGGVPSYGGESGPTSGDTAALLPAERMIVRNGNMSVVVDDVNAAIQQITQLAETYQGWVVSSNAWQNGEQMQGTITIRVAADSYDAAVAAIRTLSQDVTSESTTGYDVTEEYVDLSAQLETLQASADQLTALMQRAGTVDEILKVQQQLTQTTSQIEQIKGRMQYLQQSSATSSIAVNLQQSKLSLELTANTRTVKAGGSVTFRAAVTGGFTPYSYQWDFGDGTTSTEAQPAHKYTKAGTYSVQLTVTDDHGGTANQTRADYVEVLAGWQAGGTVTSAVNGLATFGHVLLNILIWLGIFSPVWLVIGGLVYWRLRRRKAKA